MSLQKSLVQPFRRNLLLIGAGWRSYYAPYNQVIGSAVADTSQGPKIFDMQQGPFTDAGLTNLGWTDLGWIKDFAITQESKIGKIRSGYRGAVRSEVRGQIGEKIAFKFRELGRMQMKIATGNDVFNLLKGGTASVVGPVTGSGSGQKVGFVSYNSTDPSITVATGSGALFAKNDLIVVDVDYNPATSGLIGDNATPVFPGAVTDVDYIRKTSDYVARVSSVVADKLFLSKPFVGGGSGSPTANLAPQAGSLVQKLSGFASREGATHITEWSALFILDTVDISQIVVYYPHLAIDAFRGIMPWAIEDAGTTDESGFEMDTSQEALAFDDPIDGQTMIGYRAFYPPIGADLNI